MEMKGKKNGMSFGVIDGQTCPVQNQRNNLPRGMFVEKSKMIDKSLRENEVYNRYYVKFWTEHPSD
jgi:hypothetical protein